uniref:Uncharacterized protein n=1 Tax=Vespula pensylvanica TaxID=30213 RepID=A0A834UG37_VESPE|nr:hypothetical protein H0235_000093 [Vespula pensylvanica]
MLVAKSPGGEWREEEEDEEEEEEEAEGEQDKGSKVYTDTAPKYFETDRPFHLITLGNPAAFVFLPKKETSVRPNGRTNPRLEANFRRRATLEGSSHARERGSKGDKDVQARCCKRGASRKSIGGERKEKEGEMEREREREREREGEREGERKEFGGRISGRSGVVNGLLDQRDALVVVGESHKVAILPIQDGREGEKESSMERARTESIRRVAFRGADTVDTPPPPSPPPPPPPPPSPPPPLHPPPPLPPSPLPLLFLLLDLVSSHRWKCRILVSPIDGSPVVW